MKYDKSPYKVNLDGRVQYDINYDVERFTFLNKKSSLFNRMRDKVNEILNGVVATKPYTIDWKDVVEGYKERGVGDVPHYASQYVFAYFMIFRDPQQKADMQAMYLEIVESINTQIEIGKLPS